MKDELARGLATIALALAFILMLFIPSNNKAILRHLCVASNNQTYVMKRALDAAKDRAIASVPSPKRTAIILELNREIALLKYNHHCPMPQPAKPKTITSHSQLP